MLKNYFLIAWRNLWKNKLSTFINLVCLAVGMACCMLIVIYIKDELSYNKFNNNYENIYRVDLISSYMGEPRQVALTPLLYAPTIASDIPQVKNIARLYQRSGSMQSEKTHGGSVVKFQEQRIFFSDKDLFRIFSIKFVSGNTSALQEANSIVLTSEMALKYYGSTNVVGKTLVYENKMPLKINAVVERLPLNSDLQFDFLISFENLYSAETPEIVDYMKNDWIFNPAITFCTIDPGQNLPAVEMAINATIKAHGDERSREMHTVKITPLRNIHLYCSDVMGNPSSRSISFIYIFAAIAFVILGIANFNFINLATARAGTRIREVGMRKVLGAAKWQLISQFLSETVVLSFAAFFTAIALTYFALPLLNEVTAKQLDRISWITPHMVVSFAVFFLFTGILAGLYPAFFITRFQPVLSLKGKSGEANKKNYLRKILLVAQFSTSMVLIISAIVIYQQLQFIRNKPLGYQKEQVLTIPIFGSGASILTYGVDGPMRQRMNAFCAELKSGSGVKDITASSEMPGAGFVPGLVIPEGHSETENIFFPWLSVDYNFLSTLNIPLAAGRSFSKETGTDHISAFIINESALKPCGYKTAQEAIGKSFIRGDLKNGKKGTIIGVVKDFNFNTLDQPMQPLVMDVGAPRFTLFAVTIQPGNVHQTIKFIEQKWKEFFPERVFEYNFLDNDIANLYRDQENLSRMVEYFAAIAIMLSCLGMFSLSSFLVLQRTKEIGIRKVLGASIRGILMLLSGDFLKLVLIAIIIASPISWYIMNKWLQNYFYRIDIAPWMFMAAGAFVLVITILTVGLHSIKAAITNPIKSLRTE
jgi:putative ABC transport system permease protein